MRIRSLSIGLCAGLITLLGAYSARAAESECRFGEQLDALAAVQKTAAENSLEALRAELVLRKNILSSITDCGIRDAKNLLRGLNLVAVSEQSAAPLRDQFAARLNQAIEYYELQKSRLDDLGLQATKDTAKNMREWRRSIYTPLADRAGNFIIWTKNQALIRAAKNRLSQVNQTIQTLKLADYEEVKNFWSDAERNVWDAERLNEDARSSLGRFDDPEVSLAIIKNSLQALSLTYQNFFDLSESVKQIVPL
ncbi:MAG: hypothetical protein A3A43_03155 [Candidatus Liptonbacteria bacterium RIFCSPLOWO2_01_FULL_56_20]|uniref:DUF5667 domain-containing protein n=1 Tax=Candidatus Liptonbacteria bacterium RIFCSPLOWO2_01_FULL_56_20 TaxID=1798652 RepID=A0A1G2CHC3_9BACT|nr:MAG: hypothetical protein UY96_C0026G0004 [Parcubacteria group bacterium GW2011_GWB1_56_8]OGZ00627.1 MAG: hypothetical protein A3A43_03155 [Candidatus Liptonbacteria bacterium RIFCSPLOWO2_01_FULL_56_20]